MKLRILQELDMMIENEEPVTYRKLAARLKTVPSTITYQFRGRENLIKAYFDYKYGKEYMENSCDTFSQLLEKSFKINYTFFNTLDFDISINTVTSIHNELLTKYFSEYQKLYIEEYGVKDDLDMLMKMSFVHLMSADLSYYQQILGIDANQPNTIMNLLKNK